jgi:hypothetical protein
LIESGDYLQGDQVMMRKLLVVMSLIFILFTFPAVALAQGPGPEGVKVYFGNNVTLEEGDSVEGGVIIFGGNFTMKEGSEVEGDVVVFGGNVRIEGEIDGDVATLGGNVTIRDNAVIKGDVSSLGGNVSVAEGAEVVGVIADGLRVDIDNGGIVIPNVPEIETPRRPAPPEVKVPVRVERPEFGFAARAGRFIGDGVQDIFWALIIAGLSVLIMLFFPANVRLVQDTLNQATPVSFVVGLVTLLATAAVIGLLALFFWLILPICGIVFVALALGLGWLGGWAVVGKYLGGRIFATFDNPTPTEISATFLGVTVLTLLATMPFVDHLPWVGWMFSLAGFLVVLMVGSTGLGAVVLSRFGTQSYQPISTTASATVIPVASETDAIEAKSTDITGDSEAE